MSFSAFIQALAPSAHNQIAAPEMVDRYRDWLPVSLLDLWQTHGFGFYGDGLLQLINPDDYRDNLWGWLMRDEADMSRLPIALTAFGGLIYYRQLDEAICDVAYIDTQTSSTSVLAYDLASFFNECCLDPEVQREIFQSELLAQSRACHGSLKRNEVYALSPVLRLGGDYQSSMLHISLARPYLDWLLELALDEGEQEEGVYEDHNASVDECDEYDQYAFEADDIFDDTEDRQMLEDLLKANTELMDIAKHVMEPTQRIQLYCQHWQLMRSLCMTQLSLSDEPYYTEDEWPPMLAQINAIHAQPNVDLSHCRVFTQEPSYFAPVFFNFEQLEQMSAQWQGEEQVTMQTQGEAFPTTVTFELKRQADGNWLLTRICEQVLSPELLELGYE
ncbi:hypothetical protein VST7929_01892 [Vibrio stylophorae]|uniref:GAD-related domain-containing protein n=1 Tax=Vibrio stylophorae TaxID=659351 RepID=A0ABM8ZUK2_9VIBR|nr:GAD-like domain-containing protein [Vibrio stylophorae]CAH0534010.1 hypothetical protein VST7929_01892 [Vibrio stylophorae]